MIKLKQLNQSNKSKPFIFIISFLVFLSLGLFWAYQNKEKIIESFSQKETLPQAIPFQEVSSTSQSTPSPPPSLPSQINLDVPFTCQAPYANWDYAHEEACEEASVLMAAYYLKNKKISSPQEAEKEILALQDYQRKLFGFYESTTAEQTAQLIEKYYGLQAEVKYKISLEDIKREVALGYPVILPCAGRLLPNPNFRRPGPIYHMLVVRGYTPSKIITNDPGTRKGKEFTYLYQDLYKAIANWNGQAPDLSQKVMIVVKK